MNSLETATPQEILEWACARFENICAAASFGKDSVVVLHMLQSIRPIPVIFLSTGYAFPETLKFMKRLEKEWGLEIVRAEPQLSVAEQDEQHGKDLYRTDPGLCCSLRKVEPMNRVLLDYQAWITGLRRDESPLRASIGVFEEGPSYKINPLANWTETMVWDYIRSNNVPYHPLYDQGYRSLGCQPCTRAGKLGQFERAGRWSGTDKEGGECGLHLSEVVDGT